MSHKIVFAVGISGEGALLGGSKLTKSKLVHRGYDSPLSRLQYCLRTYKLSPGIWQLEFNSFRGDNAAEPISLVKLRYGDPIHHPAVIREATEALATC